MNYEALQEPYNLPAECSVLGGLIIGGDVAYDRIADIISADDFYLRRHQLIFTAIAAMTQSGDKVDAVTLAERLDRNGHGGETGGLAYLGEMASNTPSAANVHQYAKIVVEKRMARQLLNASREMEVLANGQGSIEERMSSAQDLVMKLAESSISNEPRSINAVLTDLVGWIQERHESDVEITGVETGFIDLDAKTSGLQRGNLIIVAGRPAMGKTTFAMNIAEHVASAMGGSVMVFSMEMSEQQLAMRTVASLGSIPLDRVLNPKKIKEDEDWTKLSVAIGKMHDRNMYIDDSGGISPGKMHAKARRHKRKHGLDLIVVDYLQLMSADNAKGRGRVEEISEISRNLKMIAKDLDVPIVALSQLSRKVEERQDKRPLMSDLRESGSIEQDADVIIMMYRDDYYNPDSQYKGLAEAIIQKQRMGATGRIGLLFEGEFSRFRNYSGGLPDDCAPEPQRHGGSFRRGSD